MSFHGPYAAVPSQLWGAQRFDYHPEFPNKIEYYGVHLKYNATTTDTGWHIFKYKYDGTGRRTFIQGPLTGAWSEKGSLTWV
jgi:hypothetical protein